MYTNSDTVTTLLQAKMKEVNHLANTFGCDEEPAMTCLNELADLFGKPETELNVFLEHFKKFQDTKDELHEGYGELGMIVYQKAMEACILCDLLYANMIR